MKHWRGGLLLAVVGVLLIWAWLTATDGVQRPAPMADAMASTSATEPDETQSAPAPATGAERSPTSVPPRAGDSADAGDLPSPEHLVALGAVLADTPPNALPPVGQRLAQAREAIVAFSDRVERLEQQLTEAQQGGTDTGDIERKLLAAEHQLQLARFAERANEAELEGHSL